MPKAVIPFGKKSLFFAPMEGITDPLYRETILKLYPEWDFYFTDFLRIPSTAVFPDRVILSHFGETIYKDINFKDKTVYQILTSDNSLTEESVQRISDLGFKWLDLNLGCPSKTVCKNGGGSFILSDLNLLRSIIKKIRTNYPHFFSTKIRLGYEDSSSFDKIIELLNEEGVDAITVHARTRAELYHGTANWSFVKRAVELSSVPIIGNGDIWTLEDIDRYFEYTKCHSVMLARPALKTPWIAKLRKDGKTSESMEERIEHIKEYYFCYLENLLKENILEEHILKRLKSISRYIFEGIENEAVIKRKFLLSHSLAELTQILNTLNSF